MKERVDGDAAALDARLLDAAARRGKAVPEGVLLRAARIGRPERALARERLVALEASGRLTRTVDGRWIAPEQAGLVPGRLELNPAGFGFVRPDGGGDDVYVADRHTGGAMHGDHVLVQRGRRVTAKGPSGRVVRVLVRASEQLVGVFRTGRTAAVLVPQDPRQTAAIVVPHGRDGGASDGELVVARLDRFPGPRSPGEAHVVQVLGPATDPRVETLAVIHAHGLPLGFPGEVEAEARTVARPVGAAEREGRLDLRELPLVTIDGENARDFDDAVHVARDGAGFLLTVAVADVAHYVRPESPLDREARTRGTSVYFPDRVVPMLPEALSNDVCSLRPDEDRLCMVARVRCDGRGRVHDTTFHAGVMRSAARLTYTRVREALVDRDVEVRRALGPLLPMLEDAEALARLLMARRRLRGAIDFDLPEAQIVLDLQGRPEAIIRAERSIAHQLIEEFMLCANEAVARFLASRTLPALHRVHLPPAPDALRHLAQFLEGFGLRLAMKDGEVGPKAVQHVLEAARGRPEERLIHTVVLRSMMQARYAAEPLGHYGLATRQYLHFTSPIRRYPDLIVHRILKHALGAAGGFVPGDLDALGEETSRRERVAVEAEREVVALKKVQLMQEQVGTTHEGIVSGVAPFGIFVELADVFVDGLVHVSTMGDFFEHVEARHELRGRRSRRTYRVGDPVQVLVAGASVERRQIDLVLVGEADGAPRPARRGGPPTAAHPGPRAHGGRPRDKGHVPAPAAPARKRGRKKPATRHGRKRR